MCIYTIINIYICIYTRIYHISKWYMFHTFHFFHSDATSLILQVNSWAQVVLVNNESWGENISTQTKRCLYKGKTAFLGSLFWSGYPIHVPPKHVSSLPTSCSAFSSLRKTYGRKVFMEGKTRQLQHIKERMQLLFDGFNMLQYDNMVQYGSKSSWFLVLSNWIECVWCQLLLAYCHLPAIVMSFSLAHWKSSYRWPLHDFLHCLLQVVSVDVQGLRPSHQKKTESRFAA